MSADTNATTPILPQDAETTPFRACTAPPSTTTSSSSKSTTTASASPASAFFQDAAGNPLFPRLYKMRQPSRQAGEKPENPSSLLPLSSSSSGVTTTTTTAANTNQNSTTRRTATLQAWQRASKQALLAAQSNLSKGLQMAQSTLSLPNNNTNNNDNNNDNDNNSIQETTTVTQKHQQSSDKGKNQATQQQQQQQQVNTTFGKGILLEFRESTATYIVQLSSGGMLYTQEAPETFSRSNNDNEDKSPCATSNNKNKKSKKTKAKSVLELNETFLEWEKARHAEVEQECQRLGIPCTEETKQKCFACLKEEACQPKPNGKETTEKQGAALLTNTTTGKPMFPLLYKLRQSGAELVKENTQQLKKSAVQMSHAPCLLCATVCCAKHASSAFRKENVTLCDQCVHQVEHNHVAAAKLPVDVASATDTLVDLYGRALVLLQYAATYMNATAEQLEAQTKQHNEIAGVGGSSVGLASGILGVAAACTIMTPIGPPLLLGSLVMGGSATAVQAGGEAYKYYSEPNQLANRILTLQGIVDTILAKFQSMRDETLIPYLDRAVSKLEVVEEIPNLAAETSGHDTKQVVTRATATCLGSTAATSAAASLAVQEGAMAGRFVSRATTAAARTARFARFAGGALSAATLVLEARELRRTLDQMEKGNPCEKADNLRRVHANLENLPSVEKVSRTCRAYVKVRSRELFQEAMTASATIVPDTQPLVQLQEPVPAVVATDPHAPLPTTAQSWTLPESRQQHDEWQLVEEVVASLEDVARPASDDGSESIVSDISFCNVDDRSSTSSNNPRLPTNKSSLLRRLMRYKEREARNREAAALDLVV